MKLLGVWTLFLSEKLYWDGSGRMEPASMPFLLGGALKGLAGQDEGRETLAVSEGKVRTRGKGLLVGWREGKTQEDWIAWGSNPTHTAVSTALSVHPGGNEFHCKSLHEHVSYCSTLNIGVLGLWKLFCPLSHLAKELGLRDAHQICVDDKHVRNVIKMN